MNNNSSNEKAVKKQLKKYLSEAYLLKKKSLHEDTALDTSNEMMSQDALDAAERISKDEQKLQKFIENNKDRIEKTILKMQKAEDKKWYSRAWTLVKKSAAFGAKFIAKHWLEILQLLVILAIGCLLGYLLFGAKEVIKKAAKWMVKDAASLAIQKSTQTNGFGDFFDPGAAF